MSQAINTLNAISYAMTDHTKMAAHNVNDLLIDTTGTTFANMVSVTDVKLQSPKNNPRTAGVQILKVCKMTLILANNLKESTNLYKNKVLKTVEFENANDDTFVFSGSNYTRCLSDAYSVLSLARDPGQKYLEAFPQDVQGVDYVKIEGGKAFIIAKEELEQYLTPGEWKKLNEDKSVVYNKTNDATHSAVYRAFKLASVRELTIKGQTYSGQFFAQ